MGPPTSPQRPYKIASKLTVEMFGTAMLVFIGSLSTLKSTPDNVVIHAAFAHGLTIFVMINSLGHISGGHFNPAVSFGVALSGHLHPYLVLPYVISQLFGGFLGSLLVRAATHQTEFDRIIGGATLLAPDDNWHQGLICEAVLTMILVTVVLNSAVDTSDNPLAPLAIGSSLILCIFGAGSISGASMNPARSLGPAIVASIFVDIDVIWNNHYIYWVGPLAGAAIAAFFYRTFFARSARILP